MADFEKRIAVYQVLHTSAVAVGATFLALGIAFFALDLNYIMAVMTTMTKENILAQGSPFMKYFVIFVTSGILLVVVSTIITVIAIKKLKRAV
jgi:hypothetical protein